VTRNWAMSLARGEYVVFVSADATPVGRRWLHNLAVPLADPEVAGVYGKQVPRERGNVAEAYFLRRTYPDERRVKRLPVDRQLTLDDLFFSNANSVLRKSVWAQHPFDQRLYMSEDQGWGRDALQAGYALVYEPSAVVLHSNHHTLPSLFRRNFDSGHSLATLLTKGEANFLRYGGSYLTRELLDFASQGNAQHVPYLLAYEATRAAGFFLGRRAARLPRWTRRFCSDFTWQWERIDQRRATETSTSVSSASLK
jgi:rhamnosyltransferase